MQVHLREVHVIVRARDKVRQQKERKNESQHPLSLGEDGASEGHRSGLCHDMEDAAARPSTNLVVQSAFLEMGDMRMLLKTMSQVPL